MMGRDFRYNYEEPSELEVAWFEARKLVADRKVIILGAEWEKQEFQFDLHCVDTGVNKLPALSRDYLERGLFRNGFKCVLDRNPLSRLNGSMKRMACVYRLRNE